MTICIAAKCGEGVIFGAADRMVTAGDIQFEPSTPKITPLTSSIRVLTAGDTAFQAEILRELHNIVTQRVNEAPTTWLKVKELAYLYAYFHNVSKLTRAENKILTPLGLNRESFIAKQHEMSKDFINMITGQMQQFNLPFVQAIFTGVDNEGSHIYVVNGDTVSCLDFIGFASIGIGTRHAESQFMLAGHSFNSPLSETLLLTYSAKKRSEVSPGVGKETDMFMIGPVLGASTIIESEVIKKLDQEFKKIITSETLVLQEAKSEINRYIEEIKSTAIAGQQKQTNGNEHSGKKDTQ